MLPKLDNINSRMEIGFCFLVDVYTFEIYCVQKFYIFDIE